MRLFKGLRTIVPLLVLLPFISMFMLSCGGSSSSGDDPAPANLSATKVRIVDADGNPEADPLLMVEHPFIVEIGIASTTSIEGVAVDFFIIDQTAFDDAGDETAEDPAALENSTFFVGTVFLENLRAGENVRKVSLSLPYTEWMEQAPVDGVVSTEYTGWFPIPDTDYYLVGVIDPGDLIEETDEEDNRPSADNVDETMVTVRVSNDYQVTPNLILEEIMVEVPHFELKATDPVEVNSCGVEVPVAEDELNPHVKVTAIINASGKYWPGFDPDLPPDQIPPPMPIPRVDLWAELKMPGFDGFPDTLPIWIFNNEENNPTYAPKLKIRDLEPGTPMSVSLEMRLPLDDVHLQSLIDQIALKSDGCYETCDLDEACFAEEMIAGTVCDQDDFIHCGGAIDFSDPQDPKADTTNLDWGCYMNRMDGACLKQCEPDLDCMLGCTEDLVSLEVYVEAYDDYSEELGEEIPIVEVLNIANPLETELVLLPAPEPESTGAVMFETGYDKGFSAKLAYAGLHANAWAGLDSGGASAGLEAALPVVLFKGAPSPCNPETQDCPFGHIPREVFLGVRSAISSTPVPGMGNDFDNLTTVDIYAFGQRIFPKVLDFGCGETYDIDLWTQGTVEKAVQCIQKYPTQNDEFDPENKKNRVDCLMENWAFGKSTSFTKNFVVGVVPLTASFSAWGLIGAEIYMGVTVENCGPLSFEAHTGPWANLGTEVTAGVGASALSAGVGGALDPLLEDTFFATVSVLDMRVEGANLLGALHEDVTNTLTGPQGNVFFYVRYPCIRWCKKWGIPYPCGFKACQAKKSIVGFKTFEREDVLFCDEQTFVGSLE